MQQARHTEEPQAQASSVLDEVAGPALAPATGEKESPKAGAPRTNMAKSGARQPASRLMRPAAWQAAGRRVTASDAPRHGDIVQASADNAGASAAAPDKSDPLSDPFQDDPIPDKFGDADTTRTSQPETPADDNTLAPPAEPQRLEAEPAAPEGLAAPFEDTLPENQSVVEGLPPPTDESCDEYKKKCDEAISKLRDRDITKIIFGLVIEGENGEAPVEGKDFPCECVLGANARFTGRDWTPTTFTWKATGTCYKPLYFQDVQLERYGHSWNPVLQPFVSAGHFFVSVPLLPYKMGLNPPGECEYTLGFYRPGSCAPYMIEPIPLSLRAGVYQALGVTAFAFWFWPPPTGP